jgi:hypothetical protein
MESYIVRIYRRRKSLPEELVGIVERVGVEDPLAFHGFGELERILSEDGLRKRRRRGKREEDGEPPAARRETMDTS